MEWIKNLLAKLNGWKTYIAGIGGILTSLAAFLNGAIDLPTLGQAVWTAILAMTVRHSITTTVSKATGTKL